MLTKISIRAAVLLVRNHPLWRDPGIARALATAPLDLFEAKAKIAAKEKGGTRAEHFLKLLREHIELKLKRAT